VRAAFIGENQEPIRSDHNLWPLPVHCPKEKYSSNQGLKDKANESKRKFLALV
jgi:hypothetical protein